MIASTGLCFFRDAPIRGDMCQQQLLLLKTRQMSAVPNGPFKSVHRIREALGRLVGLPREITSGTKTDGHISCGNNSRLFGGGGGNRRVTGPLAQAAITSKAERPEKTTPLTGTKTSQIEKSKERDVATHTS